MQLRLGILVLLGLGWTNSICSQPNRPQLPRLDAEIKRNNQKAMEMVGYQAPVVPPTDPVLRSQFIIDQYNHAKQTRKQKQLAELKALLQEDMPPAPNREEATCLTQTRIYQDAFTSLMDIQRGLKPFSLKQIVFTVENAYLDNHLQFKTYNQQIAAKVKLLRKLMKSEKISAGNSLGKNYLIQKLFAERIIEYKDTVIAKVHQPYRYNFDDFMGKEDWSHMFVTRLLGTGKGQCHSLPLLYLILAEELNAKAWLSLAPEHSFVIFSDNAQTTFYNFETTNGHPISADWLMESGFISAAAIKNRIYLDTLGKNGLMACCLADLVMGYKQKFGYDSFMEAMVDSILHIYPLSIQGQMMKADILSARLKFAAKQKDITTVEGVQSDAETQVLYSALQQQNDLIDGLGYMEMPQERYAAWLRTLDHEKRKQEKQKLKSVLINEVQRSN